ncbi:MAG: acetyltransferase family protein [Bryobacterales bacterium]|nr:acetyltransferase family protein [Bryobacterales bacterium]
MPAMKELIALSVEGLQSRDYTAQQRAAALDVIFGVDSQLVRDGTYLLAELDGKLVGCGAWSRRNNRFGGDNVAGKDDNLLEPGRDAARIRSFFIHPDFARRGIGSVILRECESRASGAGFTRLELVATVTGEALYAAHGYTVDSRDEVPLAGGLKLPVIPMSKPLR